MTHALSRVQSESARMTVLVDELLLLARLDAGRPLEREPVDLSRLAIETTSDAQVARVDHRWRLDLPDEPVLVEGDELRLHQVLANLLSNAGKHTPPGSTVSVALRPQRRRSRRCLAGDGSMRPHAGAAAVQRGVVPPGPRVELSITDDGPGIPPELLPELFERFTRADTGRARKPRRRPQHRPGPGHRRCRRRRARRLHHRDQPAGPDPVRHHPPDGARAGRPARGHLA